MEIGDLVRALRGRDSGRIFLVIGHAVSRVLLVDGETRPIARPKSKNLRHVEPVGKAPEEFCERIRAGHIPTDPEVRAVISQEEGGGANAER